MSNAYEFFKKTGVFYLATTDSKGQAKVTFYANGKEPVVEDLSL